MRLLKLGWTIALVAGLVWLVGWDEIRASLAATRLPWLGGMYAVVAANFVLMAFCLRLLLTRCGVEIGLGRVLVANALASSYALVLPGDLAAGVSKWMVLATATGERTRGLLAIVLNKGVLAAPTFVVGAAALAYEEPFPGVRLAAVLCACAAIGFLALAVRLAPGAGAVQWKRAELAGTRLPAALRSALAQVAEATRLLAGLRARDHLALLALATGIYGLGSLAIALALRSLGGEAPVTTFLWIPLALFVSRLLPITVGNLGIREGVLIAALGIHGIDEAVAVGTGLLLFSHAVLMGIAGAGCQLAIGLGWLRLARADSAAVAAGREAVVVDAD